MFEAMSKGPQETKELIFELSIEILYITDKN